MIKFWQLLVFVSATLPIAFAGDEFLPIFDGKSLAGWFGQDMRFWSVEDGAITGTIAPTLVPPMNQYLVWQGGLVEDFELKLEFRLTGSNTRSTNGGFQFRSRLLPNGDVAGYQVDNNFGMPWKVRLYDEFGRHDLALQGQRSIFSEGGKKAVENLNLEPGADNFQLDRWHEYHLTAVGPKQSLRINGNLVAETTDNDADSFESIGILAMQLHTGPSQKAQFRKLRLKRLGNASPPESRRSLLAHAALYWRLGDRIDSHQPPLNPIGDVEVELLPTGDNSTPGARIARLKNAYFDLQKDLNQPKAWNVAGSGITVYVRARVPQGRWKGTLFSKHSPTAGSNFSLFAPGMAAAPSLEMAFQVSTERGNFSAGFQSDADADAWHDFVGRYDGQRLQIICDGKVRHEVHATGALVPNLAPILIGAAANGEKSPAGFTGELQEVGLWTRALSDRELKAILAK